MKTLQQPEHMFCLESLYLLSPLYPILYLPPASIRRTMSSCAEEISHRGSRTLRYIRMWMGIPPYLPPSISYNKLEKLVVITDGGRWASSAGQRRLHTLFIHKLSERKSWEHLRILKLILPASSLFKGGAHIRNFLSRFPNLVDGELEVDILDLDDPSLTFNPRRII
jgi:hypothetical protein